MKRATNQFRAYYRTAILILLAALGWFAPSRVQATCGDYLTVGTAVHHMPAISGRDVQMPAHAFTTDSFHSQTLDARNYVQTPIPASPCRCPADPGKAPCRGPLCSGSHSPLNVPPTTVEGPRNDGAAGWPLPRFGDFEPLTHAFLDVKPARIHHVLLIYHPPRSV
jgi:hypothetical protein